MSYFQLWSKRIADTSHEEKYREYVQRYYDLEKEAYDRILTAFPDNGDMLSGTALDLSKKMGIPYEEMEVFVGFIDGIQTSLVQKIDPETIEDDTPISLQIDYEQLYWNMLDAKADWLYQLASWDRVLSGEKRGEITKDFRTSKIIHREKIGRNDLCPCGSGKKYKNCCIHKSSES